MVALFTLNTLDGSGQQLSCAITWLLSPSGPHIRLGCTHFTGAQLIHGWAALQVPEMIPGSGFQDV